VLNSLLSPSWPSFPDTVGRNTENANIIIACIKKLLYSFQIIYSATTQGCWLF
jgi:hypothetical protein